MTVDLRILHNNLNFHIDYLIQDNSANIELSKNDLKTLLFIYV